MIAVVEKICPQCDKPFHREGWRHQRFCSLQCGIDFRKGKTYETRKCLYCEKEFQAEKWEKTKYCSFKCGIEGNRGKSRIKISKCKGRKIRYRPSRVLEDGRRVAIHRHLIEQILERRLTSEEQVHHKDMNSANNELNNLWLYKNAREHTKGHKSLEKLVFWLLEKGIIEFKGGKYIAGKNRKG